MQTLNGWGQRVLRWRWRTAPASVWWLGLCVTFGAQAMQPVAVQLRWVPQFQFAGYYVALERGYYREAGLEVELRPGGPGAAQAIDAVVSDRAEFGVSSAGLSAAHMNGKPVVAVAAILQQSASVWLARGSTTWHGLSDWAHLRAMRLPAPEETLELLAPFAAAGIRPDAMATVPTSYSVESFIHGDADLYSAYLSNEPFELEKRGLDYHVIKPADHGVHFYGDVLFTSRRFASQHPDAVARFRDATLRGWQAAFDDIAGTARMIQSHYAPTRSLDHLVYEGEQLRRLSGHGDLQIGHMSAARWAAIAEQQRALGFGQRPLRMEDFLFMHGHAVQPVWPDPVRVSLVGVVLCLLLCLARLLSVNKRLGGEAESARERDQTLRTDALRFQFLMDVAPFPMLIYALDDGGMRYANERAQGWLAPGAELGRGEVQQWLPQLGPGTPAMQRLRQGRLLVDLEIELPDPQRRPSRWCLVTVRAIEYGGQACGFATFSDLSARKNAELELSMLSEQRGRILAEVEQLQARMREASLRDPLTGLFNRRYYDVTVDRELARAQRDAAPLALLVIDVDHFKAVNDRYGHAGGDEVLRNLGGLLQAMHRSGDVVCRFGGEEFVVVMPGADAMVARQRAELLRQRIGALEITCDGGIVRFTASIGVAVRAGVDETALSLFKRADEAVYRAKRQGRNCVVLDDAEQPADAATGDEPASLSGTA